MPVIGNCNNCWLDWYNNLVSSLTQTALWASFEFCCQIKGLTMNPNPVSINKKTELLKDDQSKAWKAAIRSSLVRRECHIMHGCSSTTSPSLQYATLYYITWFYCFYTHPIENITATHQIIVSSVGEAFYHQVTTKEFIVFTCYIININVKIHDIFVTFIFWEHKITFVSLSEVSS